MTLDTYLRILRDRLEEAEIDEETVERTMSREKSTVAGISEDDIESFFSEERLSFLIAAAKRRSRNTQKKTATPEATLDETSTVVPQDSQTLVTDATIAIPTATEEKTVISPALPSTKPVQFPKSLLENDTATIVISRASVDTKPQSISEEATIPSDNKLDKLLLESATVRISEKDTVEFLTVVGEEATILPDVIEPLVNEEKTAMIFPVTTDEAATILPTVTPTTTQEDVNLLPLIDKAHVDKKAERENDAVYSDATAVSELLVTEADLINPHPTAFLVLLALILVPLFVVIGVLYLSVFLTIYLVLLLLTYLPIFIYVLIVSASGGGAIYGGFTLIRAYMRENILSLTGGGIFLLSVGIFVLSLLFLHRAMIPVYYFFKAKTKAFVRFNSFGLHNLLKILFKGIRHA